MSTSQWLTWDEAAELVGCPVATIDWHKRQGRIVSRGRCARSLERELQTVIAIGFIVLAVRDSKQVKRIGLSTTPGYSLFAGVFYLFHRMRVEKSTPAIAIAGLVPVVFGIVALNTFAAIADFGSSEVEQEIEAWAIRNDLGQLGISCPEVVGRVGDEFRCSVFSGGLGIVRGFAVTIKSNDSITWQAGFEPHPPHYPRAPR